jgi:hypothetical protein
MFTDSSCELGKSYYYRVAGNNSSGTSPASNVIGPIISTTHTVMDNLETFELVYSKSDNLSISSETYPRLRQTEEDYYQAIRLQGIGPGELVYKADQIKSISVFVFSDSIDIVSLEYSSNGKKWQSAAKIATKKLRPGYPSQISKMKDHPIDKITYTVDDFPVRTRYVRIIIGNADSPNSYPWIGRVHLQYTGSLK